MASFERISDDGRHRRSAKKPRPAAAAGSSPEYASIARRKPLRASKLPKAKLRPPEHYGLDDALLEIAEIWRDIQTRRRPPKSK
jgi:hypothetical protein